VDRGDLTRPRAFHSSTGLSQQLLIQLVDDLSFIPISVFIVVVVLERLLTRQEKLQILHKLNMAIGAFFSEVGNAVIHKLLIRILFYSSPAANLKRD
jgi:hypothetical protein